MLFRIALCGLTLASGALAAESGKSRRIGPWNVVAFSEKGQFQHCIMARPEVGDTPGYGLAKGRSYLTLALFSDKWKLDPGSTYPVTLVAAGVREEVQASVEGTTTVGIPLGGREALVNAMFSASSLEVRTPASTLRLPMDRSAAAMRALNECFQNESQVASNPFGPATPPAKADNPFAKAEPPKPATTAPAPAAPSPADSAHAKARADCEQDSDPDRQIAGCTTVIESGRETREVKGIALANRGFGYAAKGDAAKALASFTQAIEFYPAYANARWGRADIYFSREAWDEAIRDYEAALTIDPKDEYSRQRRTEAQTKKVAAATPKAPAAPPDMAGAFGRMGEAVTSRAAPPPTASAPGPTVAPSPPNAAGAPAKDAGPAVAAVAPPQAATPSPALPSPAAPPARDPVAEMRQEAVTAIAMIGLVPQTCGYRPVLPTIGTIASVSELSPEMLDAAPYADWRRADAQRLQSEAAADKAGFCARAWAEYGEGGKTVPGVFTR